MMDNMIIDLIVIASCMVLSAFFSGSEAALFSLKKSDLHSFSVSDSGTERSISQVMKNPQNILITLLTANLCVNLLASEISANLLLDLWQEYGHFISIAILTPLIILLCEITPKLMAINVSKGFSRKIYPFLSIFHKLFYPVRMFLMFFSFVLIKIFGLKLEQQVITEDELDHAVIVGEREGVIEKEEGFFIKNVLRFSKKEASNIMFPRSRATFIPYGTAIDEAMKTCLDAGVIRAPVYRGDFDHIVGMVDSRDLMPYYLGMKKTKTKSINRFVKDIDFFPSSRELNDLLRDFLSKGIQIAILVDEYGGTAGVVTLNAILSQLLGRKFTKWEVDQKPFIRKIDDNVVVISGEMQIVDFNYSFGESISSVDSATIGGYITEKLQSFPQRGESIESDKYLLRVRFIRNKHIESIEVIKKDLYEA